MYLTVLEGEKRGKNGGKKKDKKKNHDPKPSRANGKRFHWALEQVQTQGCSLISNVLALNWQLRSALATWTAEKAGNVFKTHLNEAL